MTPKQLATLLGVTPQCVGGWCRTGALGADAERVGNRWVIHWSPLLATALPVIGHKQGADGKLVRVVGKRLSGRPPGSKNKKPYPKGVKRARKNGFQ